MNDFKDIGTIGSDEIEQEISFKEGLEAMAEICKTNKCESCRFKDSQCIPGAHHLGIEGTIKVVENYLKEKRTESRKPLSETVQMKN